MCVYQRRQVGGSDGDKGGRKGGMERREGMKDRDRDEE